jgi:hypothetical protein
MTSSCPIEPGTSIEMAFSPADVEITVQSVPDVQPYAESDGIWLVVDQYDEEHMVQLDGDTWVTTSHHELTARGTEIWIEVQEGRYVPPATPAP